MKVLVLGGGRSSESEVSARTAASVGAALAQRNHQVVQCDPEAVHARLGWAQAILDALERERPDVVFVALHGGAGENGTVQALLDLAGVPYTGSGARASALAMDKAVSKTLMDKHGIPTAAWVELSDANASLESALELGLPLVVKPVEGGSTVGISIVRREDELAAAVALAREHDARVLVERFVDGRELTVGVLEGESLPIVEIVPNTGFYDYRAKYTSGASRYIVPAALDPSVRDRLASLAAAAHTVLGCRGATRVDFRLSLSDEPFCLELNTVPGMTSTSLLPMAAAAAGLDFPVFVERLCSLALATR